MMQGYQDMEGITVTVLVSCVYTSRCLICSLCPDLAEMFQFAGNITIQGNRYTSILLTVLLSSCGMLMLMMEVTEMR